MDPLSISASVVALCGAVASVSKGLRYAASIRKAPIEFLDLQNQVGMVAYKCLPPFTKRSRSEIELTIDRSATNSPGIFDPSSHSLRCY